MSIAETIKYIGFQRKTQRDGAKRNNIARPFRTGTPPRPKTIRRLEKQIQMGLSNEHKEVFVPVQHHPGRGIVRHPTKGTAYGVAFRVEHPDPEAAKVKAPFFGVARVTMPRKARKSKDQKRQRHAS